MDRYMHRSFLVIMNMYCVWDFRWSNGWMMCVFVIQWIETSKLPKNNFKTNWKTHLSWENLTPSKIAKNKVLRFFRTLKKHHLDRCWNSSTNAETTPFHTAFSIHLWPPIFLGTWKNVRLGFARSKPKIPWISWRNLVWPLRLSRSKVNDPMNRSASLGMGGWDSPP